MSRMGRKSKLTSDVADRIENAIKAHAPLKEAAKHGGVDPATFFRWMAVGEHAQSGAYRNFYERMSKARADAQIASLARIQKAAIGGTVKTRKTTTRTNKDGSSTTTVTETFYEPQWTADAWLLERRNPSEYARLTRTELTGRDGRPIEVEQPDEQRRESVLVKLDSFRKKKHDRERIEQREHEQEAVSE